MTRTTNYINRLKKLGYSPASAMRIIQDFYKCFNEEYLNAFITSIENERNESLVSK